jgi:hypothetical protein
LEKFKLRSVPEVQQVYPKGDAWLTLHLI